MTSISAPPTSIALSNLPFLLSVSLIYRDTTASDASMIFGSRIVLNAFIIDFVSVVPTKSVMLRVCAIAEFTLPTIFDSAAIFCAPRSVLRPSLLIASTFSFFQARSKASLLPARRLACSCTKLTNCPSPCAVFDRSWSVSTSFAVSTRSFDILSAAFFSTLRSSLVSLSVPFLAI